MFKHLRVIALFYVLLFVAVAQFLAARRSTDWDNTLWVDVYPVNGDGLMATQRYLDELDRKKEFAPIEEFFAAESHRYGLELAQPFRLNVAKQYDGDLPILQADPSPLATLWWSLEMRWIAAKLSWSSSAPSPDIVVFAVFHEAADSAVLDRSTALRKGLIAVANLFAEPLARGSNQMVVAHELLHTLGATDKYSLANNFPSFPDGFADPEAKPLLPQAKAEIMAGRIPLAEQKAEIPDSLRRVVVGRATALEIGWLGQAR
jgi:hypothetical protein